MESRMTGSIASSSSRTASACSPLAAMTTSKPSRRRTASSTSRRTSSSSTMRMRICLGSSVLCHTGSPRQRYRELRPVPRCALYGDVTLRRVQDAAGDGQAKARTPLPAFRCGQRLENPADELWRDSLAVVPDPNFDPSSIRFGCDPDVAMVGDRVASVQENVGQNLLQVVKVPSHLDFRDL